MVTESSGDELVNPYSPPAAGPAEPGVVRSTIAVRFTGDFLLKGAPTDQQLRSILKTEQKGSLLGVVSLVVGPFLMLAMLAIMPALFVIGLGFYGLAFVTHFVSMMGYRVGMFKNQFPQWNAMDGGRIGADGITLFAGDSWSLYRWDYFSHAIVTKTAVSLVPNLESKCPLLIGDTMLQSALSGKPVEDWRQFIKALGVQLEHVRGVFYKYRPSIDPKRRSENLKVMCDRQRARSIDLEAGAIPFSGDVTTDDVGRIPGGMVGLTRTSRSRVVVALLMLFAGLILGGTSAIVFEASWILLALGMLYALAFRVRSRGNSRTPAAGCHYFLLGQATPDRVTLDLGISVSSFAWSDLKLLVADDDFIAFGAGGSGRLIVVRSDMFELGGHWERFVTLAK